MITDWRKKFDLPDMSFFFVQLSAYFPHRDFTAVRNAQMAGEWAPSAASAYSVVQ
jgi:hypothetical protein